MTNADRIRQMTDEELAKMIETFDTCAHCVEYGVDVCSFPNGCRKSILAWLKQEVSEDA